MTRRMSDPAFRDDQMSRIDEPQVRAINALCDELMLEKPQFSVPYIAPHYGASTAVILALSSNPGPQAGGAKGSGMLSRENNDGSAARMSDIYETVGLTDDQIVPWNAYPWHVHETHPNGLPNNLIDDGLDALKRVLDRHPNIHSVVAHGGDAHRSVKQFMSKKRFGAYADARGLKVWNTRHTSNRAFILREPEKSIALEGVCEVYREAMRHAGLKPIAALKVDLPAPMTGPELRTAARGELLPLLPGAVEAEARISEYVNALPAQRSQRLLVELLLRDLAS
ncbi:uracil-DNA glycosylase [Cryobacterium sp. TMT2-42-4]|uniref:uracil-DNA glycosylase n=1 Tax=Cryobacterium sp. TMT2-42-4 TaxID=1259255 RepID=UPI00106C8885|nr:uracil-DNA glycosylase [Cryobacterium sp. TMT2-42-4]TFC36229.1 uracil-DNA glycosylase [Cryobacterium sp. TMT2-42-4]